MQADKNVPPTYTQYFSLILKPTKKGQSKPGEIEKAYGDSWVDNEGSMRAFIGKVRSDNGTDFNYDLFVADIPLDIDITTTNSGSPDTYPSPAKGINIRRLTTGMKVDGIVRGSFSGEKIAFTAEDEYGVNQIFIINSEGSGNSVTQITNLKYNAEAIRWHNSDNWIIYLSGGNVYTSPIGKDLLIGGTFQLSNDNRFREHLVVSRDGNSLAYIIRVPSKNKDGKIVKDVSSQDFRQIFTMDLDWDKIHH